MKLEYEIHTNTGIIKKVIEYPSQNKISFSLDPKNQKIKINKITINGLEASIWYNTSFAIDDSDVVLTSVHEITKKGVYTVKIDDLYILSNRSNNWHCSADKQDFIFQYEHTNNSFVDTYRDRDHTGFVQPFIPCFGCSFTYGAHQNSDASWPFLLKQKTNQNYLNLGSAGAGIDGIYNNLKLLHSNYKFNKCIILFPNFERRIVRCVIDNLWFRTYSTIDIDGISSEFHFYRNEKFIDRMMQVRDCIIKDVENTYSKKFLQKIISYCKHNSIDLFASSWDDTVYEYIKTQPHIRVLEKFTDMSLHKERANDGVHPHRKHYQTFVDYITDSL
jgi:hypothetical protein